MKNTIKILSSVFIMAILVIAGFTGKQIFTANPVMANEYNNINTITARGQGTIKVKPDIAYITMGVRTEHEDAETAQSDNAKKMDEVINALKEMGIEERDIQTSNYSIYPQYDYEAKGGERIIGYTVENTVNVTIRDINKVGEVLDTGVEKGANVSRGIQFSVSNTEEYYKKALKQAIENAKGKAEAMGEAINVSIKNPISVTELSSGGNNIIYADQELLQNKVNLETPISIGELDINASVEVVYQY
ncbi:SIMPL domain-containing protein [Defluviitalea phaphyphila]|uniref:SIMPL domain-containing protein n=1 Tax=Defluviitalea phaphyphila TaxID=1473580 RepID=UPI0007309C06|nr:SIMPL domain-containing protein [Defluviitalea phaphyphila]